MVKYTLILLILLMGDSPIKFRFLKNGVTRVPSDPEFFDKNYSNKYTISLPQGIYTDAVYIEQYYVDFEGKLFRTGIEREGEIVSALKFYDNGCINRFSIKNAELNNISELDPEEEGYRGIAFIKKNKSYIDIVGPINQNYKLGIISYEIKVSGDTLFVNNYRANSKYIYLKQKISSEQNKYTADW